MSTVARDAEIYQFDFIVIIDENILRFHISMDDFSAFQVVQSLQKLFHDGESSDLGYDSLMFN